ncbi:MAG: DUF3592 domain-containing protein [Verrucomicrobiota bacterium]|nr:DUF3592 domain-containing protein [Verrucomicrobiota bacterium]
MDSSKSSSAEAEQVIKNYTPGTVVSVYYNPKNPEISVLHPHGQTTLRTQLLIALILLGTSGILLANSRRIIPQ